MKCAYDIKTLHLLNGKIRRAFIVMSALVVALVVGVGCIKREPVDDRVSEVESIAQQNPEEALRIIQNIDRTSLVKNEDGRTMRWYTARCATTIACSWIATR